MKELKSIFKILGILVGGMLFFYFYFCVLPPNQKEINAEILETCVPLQYDFKILYGSDGRYFDFEGRTKEGRTVKFKVPRHWNLEGLYSEGDSIHKLAGEKELYLIKPDTIIKLELMSNDEGL